MASSLLNLRVGQVLNILQQHRAYERGEIWSQRAYNMQRQTMRIDMINTVREEMRDQVRLIMSSVDRTIFVATLVLSIGFGFVCEGTFPDSEEQGAHYLGVEHYVLEAYSVLLAMTLVLPLGSLMLMVAVRREAERCFRSIVGDLQTHIRHALRRALPSELQSGQPDEWLHRFAAGGGADAAEKDERLVRDLAQGLLQKVTYFHILYPVAELLLWLGMLSAVMLCSVFLGLILYSHFPSMPHLWLCYSGIAGTGGAGCAIFAFWIYHSLPTTRSLAVARAKELRGESLTPSQPASPASSSASVRSRRAAWDAADGGLAEPLLGSRPRSGRR